MTIEKNISIFDGNDQEHAEFIRGCVKSLGGEIPAHWSDEAVIEFFNTLSNDAPRIYTDMEKADMKYQAQMAE